MIQKLGLMINMKRNRSEIKMKNTKEEKRSRHVPDAEMKLERVQPISSSRTGQEQEGLLEENRRKSSRRTS